MARSLRVHKTENGPAVKCPRCDELISPSKDHLFDGFDCPECGQIIEEEALTKYFQAVDDYDEDDGDFF